VARQLPGQVVADKSFPKMKLAMVVMMIVMALWMKVAIVSMAQRNHVVPMSANARQEHKLVQVVTGDLALVKSMLPLKPAIIKIMTVMV
jgi:hypothetical protein